MFYVILSLINFRGISVLNRKMVFVLTLLTCVKAFAEMSDSSTYPIQLEQLFILQILIGFFPSVILSLLHINLQGYIVEKKKKIWTHIFTAILTCIYGLYVIYVDCCPEEFMLLSIGIPIVIAFILVVAVFIRNRNTVN